MQRPLGPAGRGGAAALASTSGRPTAAAVLARPAGVTPRAPRAAPARGDPQQPRRAAAAPPAAWFNRGPGGGGGPPPPGTGGYGGGGGPVQTDAELERLRQAAAYGAAPPRAAPGGPPPPPGSPPPPPGSGGGEGGLSGYAKALVAAAFVTGLGAGVYFDAEINVSPNQVASTEIIDRRTPNSEVCMAYGYSAMVFDQRVFVTYNPFNLYVTQPEVKPGCVLRRSNFSVLEREKLVSDKQVESCKKRMNTFGFVGDLSGEPEVSCVYHSEEAENQYLLGNESTGRLFGGAGGPPKAAAAGDAAKGVAAPK
ncbi:MAG: hypothetical protein J3K34DRAFT_385131 [Monoraphidium minutum]|nr:MAG: hypothetical protein J3K34DRAFT_385131 [Monoraphidium minutum]